MKYCCRSAKARISKSIVIATMSTMTRSSSETIASRRVKPRAGRQRRGSLWRRGSRLLRELRHIVDSLAAAVRADSQIARGAAGAGDVRRHRRDRDHPDVDGGEGGPHLLGRVVHERVADLVRAVVPLDDVCSVGAPELSL